MDYELAKELKKAGFPFRTGYGQEGSYPANGFTQDGIDYYFPNLSELIEACGEDFRDLSRTLLPSTQWHCTGVNAHPHDLYTAFHGTTPEKAVARLWLALNKKSEYRT